jgi:UDP-2-acetamido-2-deoxy-ribo-hexuluronate aminotransferase
MSNPATAQPAPIAFIDLLAQRRRLGERIDRAVMKVIDSGAFIMGPEVQEFERQLAMFGQAKHALSCANGTDALILPLMAWNIGPGDAVFCPSFTFAATGEVMPLVGASPVFVDVLPDTYNMDPASLEAAIEMIKAEGKLVPRAIIAVDLFGQPADYPRIAAIAKAHGLKLIADSAQGFGCTLDGHHPIHWADVATASFFPAKPLGCYGDGGAVLTNDYGLWELMDSLRVHGKATRSDLAGRTFEHDPKYLNIRVGINSRLDTLQAAILLEKLAIFPEEIELRNQVADRYNAALAQDVIVPKVISGGVSNWAQYTIEMPDRDGFSAFARAQGVPTAAYYPMPIHTQDVYSHYPVSPTGLAVTEAKAGQVISLPMHPYLDESTQDRIIACVRAFAGRNDHSPAL